MILGPIFQLPYFQPSPPDFRQTESDGVIYPKPRKADALKA